MQHNTNKQPARNPGTSRMRFSLRHGIETWFDVDDITIRLWASSWTGKEIIRVQDQHGERVVSEKRNIRFVSPHEFSHGGHRYKVEIRLKLGVAEVRLHRDGVQIDSGLHDASKVHIDPVTGRIDRWAQFKSILPALLAGLASGAAFGYLVGVLLK